QVQLSKGSKLTYSPEGWTTQRQVRLEGEAFFDVSKGASFIVSTRTGNVEVIGTSFLVSDTEEGLAVMVESGIVKVTTSAYSEQLERGDSYLLNPTLSSISNLGTGTTYFKFIDRPIGEALDILSSMYELRLEISEVDRARRLTGFFASTDASALAFQKICSTVNLTFDMRDGVIHVS
ncbi:MAG: FecR domain-containing protein, partial [Bacteroidota bacterium]